MPVRDLQQALRESEMQTSRYGRTLAGCQLLSEGLALLERMTLHNVKLQMLDSSHVLDNFSTLNIKQK